jgi:hypothetical protein
LLHGLRDFKIAEEVTAMPKATSIIITLVLSFFCASLAFADTINMNFTADNEVTFAGLYSSAGQLVSAFTLPYAAGNLAGNWEQAYSGSLNVTLQHDTTYYLVVAAQNYTPNSLAYQSLAGGSPSLTNPVAFLGDFTVTSPFLNATYASSAAWYAMGADISPTAAAPGSLTMPLANAVDYGSNSATNTLWYGVNGNSDVSGIAGTDQWIGAGPFPGEDSPSLLVAAEFTTDLPAQAPEPATLALLGLGLLGAGWLKRRA